MKSNCHSDRDYKALVARVEAMGGSIDQEEVDDCIVLFLPGDPIDGFYVEADAEEMFATICHGYLDGLEAKKTARELCRRYDEAVADFQGVVNCEAAIPVSVVRQAFGIEEDK